MIPDSTTSVWWQRLQSPDDRTIIVGSVDAMEVAFDSLNQFDTIVFLCHELEQPDDLYAVRELAHAAVENGLECFISDHIPECIKAYYFGGEQYTQLSNKLVRIRAFESERAPFYDATCELCTFREGCRGLDLFPGAKHARNARISTHFRMRPRQKIEFSDRKVASQHAICADHLRRFDQKTTDRTIKYARAFGPNERIPEYNERFTYYCRYLDNRQTVPELNLLSNLAGSKREVETLLDYIARGIATGHAYSVAAENAGLRTSHYLYFDGSDALRQFCHDLALPQPPDLGGLRPRFIGCDFRSGAFDGCKIYLKGVNTIDIQKWLRYLTSACAPHYIFENSQRHLLACRFDRDGRMSSVKIESTPFPYCQAAGHIQENFGIDIGEPASSPFVNEYFAYDYDMLGRFRKLTCYLTVPISTSSPQ